MISVFTPSHDPRYLGDCYESLLAQTYTDWEWVVLLNGDAEWWYPPANDPRVRVSQSSATGVGAAKAAACQLARGGILVELDHDDILARHCLDAIHDAFRTNPSAALVYSNCAQVNADLTRNDEHWNEGNGWVYYSTAIDQRDVLAVRALPPTPHNVSLIWYAPNHVRAFTRAAYTQSGGYDPARMVLDDQDLMRRLYQVGPFLHIDQCLYLQRLHDAMTQKQAETNAFIQTETLRIYAESIQPLALTWAKRNNLMALDLGSAHNKPPEYLGLDSAAAIGVDIVSTIPPIDLPDNSVGVIRAVDFLEHVPDQIGLMEELHRILVPGGLLLSMTPSTDGRGAFQDPTHVSFWNENSFWYWTDQARQYVPAIKALFQVSYLSTAYPSDWHEQHNIPYVVANLIAVKEPMPRNGGYLCSLP